MQKKFQRMHWSKFDLKLERMPKNLYHKGWFGTYKSHTWGRHYIKMSFKFSRQNFQSELESMISKVNNRVSVGFKKMQDDILSLKGEIESVGSN